MRSAQAQGPPPTLFEVVHRAVAVATYLAFRRDQVDDDPGDILRLAIRAEYYGHPPDSVRGWLEEQGVPI